jgi:ankyrin repeat protein
MVYRRLWLLCCLALSLVGCVQIQQTEGQYPPLIKAAEKGDIAEAEKLLKQGYLINQKTIIDRTAIHFAAMNGHDEMITWLFSRNARIREPDATGKTPADLAREFGHPSTEQLINNYDQMDQKEHDAFNARDYEQLRQILTDQDPRHYTVLAIMVQAGSLITDIQDEIDRGADINQPTIMGSTPLHQAIGGDIEVTKLLIERGANVNAVDVYNNPPLHYAITDGNENEVNLLLEAGADIHIQNVSNMDLLEVAQKIGNQKIIDLLKQYDNP